MPRERTTMRKIREILRLKWQLGRSHREVASSCGIGYGTVVELLRRAERAGLSWATAEAQGDEELERLLYPPAPPLGEERVVPDWSAVYEEMKRKSVTLQLLWEEYRREHPKGYGYSWFCEEFRRFTDQFRVTLRQESKAGEQLQVDWAGQTLALKDGATGEEHAAYLFVASLGASQLIYAEVTRGQALCEWIAAHVHALEYFGGAPELLVPDNLKTGVTRSCRYEPELNPTYAELARHYGMAVVPARVRKPRDKAKVENAVLQAERRILARLRDMTFFEIAEANRAVGALLKELNDRKCQGLERSRRELFEQLDRPLLRALPSERYVLGLWKKVRVGPDYHVAFDRCYYSVPYQLVGQELDLRAAGAIVEIFKNSQSVARHQRLSHSGHHTIAEHMPEAHRQYLSWTPERLVRWGRHSGEATARLVEQILESRCHPQQGFRSCLGVMSLSKRYGAARLEAACLRALGIGSPTYKSVKSILATGLDRQAPAAAEEPTATRRVVHDNVRGPAYYSEGSTP